MIHTSKKISREKAFRIYRSLLLPRRIEERMLKLLRQNKISKWFSGIGQEAIATGVTLAAKPDDYILPMHRNLGVFTTREVPLYPLFCQLFGKAEGFTGGRDRSFHFGSPEHKIIGMVSHLAAMMPVADGLALAGKISGEDSVAISFCGDGASSEGDFHEAINLAAVWELPVIFVIENNGYGLSTPTREQFACEKLSDRAIGYGIEGYHIDGNNVIEVMETVEKARKSALKGKPVLIEARTFRMRGHEEASGTHYVPDILFENWSEKDPILRFEHFMLEEGFAENESVFAEIRDELDDSFRPLIDKALKAPDPVFDRDKELSGVYTPAELPQTATGNNGKRSEKRFVDAIQHSLRQAFRDDDKLIIMGQDIAEYGGVFKITEGFLEEFGHNRVRNTPIIESGAIGAAMGLALAGYKAVVEMQFADFISCGFNQIVNNLAKTHYRWSPPLNVTIRAPHGGGVGAGPYHSQSVEGWFMQIPGLKVVVPSTVEDAQSLLYASIMDPNPVLFFEHKKLYRSIRAETPDLVQPSPLGKAAVVREGSDASIITYGMGVHWALETAEEYSKQGVELEILDLRTLLPLDKEAICQTVRKTGKVLLLQEATGTLGPMSELSAIISEECFEWLDAPLIRCSSMDTPVPHDKGLEDGFLASSTLREKTDRLLKY